VVEAVLGLTASSNPRVEMLWWIPAYAGLADGLEKAT
jgi:hypothetical protein